MQSNSENNNGIELLGLFFSNVGINLEEKNFNWWSTKTVKIDSKIKDIFIKYFAQISGTKDIQSRYSAVFALDTEENSDVMINKILNKIITLKLPKDYEIFEESSLALTRHLCDLIDKRMKVPVIFVCQFSNDTKKYASILNLGLEEQKHFRIDRKAKTIEYSEIKDLLPSVDRLQKGAVSPYPQDSSIPLRIYQKGKPADYFNTYLLARPIVSTITGIKSTFSDVKKLLDRTITLQEIFEFYGKLQQEAEGGKTLLNQNEMSNIFHQIFPSLPQDQINSALEKSGFYAVKVSESGLLDIQLKISLDFGFMKGRIDGMQDDIAMTTSGSNNKIKIDSTTFDADIEG